MADYLNPQDLANAKVDAKTLGEATNDKKVVKPRYGESYKSLPMISAEGDLAITELKKAIDIAAAAGAGANGWTDKLVQTWSGRTQESRNRDIVNVRDFIKEGETDNTKSLQDAIDYAASLAKDGGRVSVVIDITLRVTRQRELANTWGYACIVPDNIIITGSGCIRYSADFNSKLVVFLVRGSNVLVSWLTGVNENTSGNNWSIFVGGGTAYDNELPSKTYSNIQCYQLLGLGDWITCSFQLSHGFNENTYFEGVEYIFCKSIAKKGNTSSGNFNFVSNPPHHIKNTKMIGCSGKFGATSTTFNHVGVDGGHVSICDSELNLYGACELESLTRDFIVSGLTSKNDAICLWIDDSHDISFSQLVMKNDIDNLVTVSHGTLGKTRNIVRVTFTKDDLGNPVVLKNIVGNNIIGTQAKIVIEPFGEPLSGSKVQDISLNQVRLTNDGIAYSGNQAALRFSGVDDITVTDFNVIGVPSGHREVEGSASKSVRLNKFISKRVGSEKPIGVLINGSADLHLDDVDVESLIQQPSGSKFHNKLKLGGVLQPSRNADQYTYDNYSGSPEGKLSANNSSIVVRKDQPRIYVKSTPTGNTGWRELAFKDEIK